MPAGVEVVVADEIFDGTNMIRQRGPGFLASRAAGSSPEGFTLARLRRTCAADGGRPRTSAQACGEGWPSGVQRAWSS